jgi:hypothetical protein
LNGFTYFFLTHIIQDEKDHAQTELHDKLSVSRQKYKNMKTANQELQTVRYYIYFNGHIIDGRAGTASIA